MNKNLCLYKEIYLTRTLKSFDVLHQKGHAKFMTIRTKVPKKLTVFIIMLFFVFVCFSLVCVCVRACVCECVICKAAASYRNRLKHTIFSSCEIKYTVMFPMMRVFLQKLRIKFIILIWYTFMNLGFLSFYIIINAYTQLKNRKCNLKQQPTVLCASVYTPFYCSHFWAKSRWKIWNKSNNYLFKWPSVNVLN